MRRAALLLFVGGAIALACKPSLNDTVSVVTGPRVLAVRADPAEAKPKDAVTYSALVVDSNGDLAAPAMDWAFCEVRKPLAELEPVSPACMARAADYLTEMGGGPRVASSIPDDACRQFGPEVPPPVDGGAEGRPVDPDPTGGYYQPVRVVLATPNGDAYTLAQSRVACGLPGVTPEQSAEYNKKYRPNANPEVEALLVNGAAIQGGSTTVAPGQRVTLRATWADCANATAPCTGSEPYVTLDLATRALVDVREAMRVSWFTTGGAFDADHTGRDATDGTTWTENGWTAPSVPGQVHLWVVVRDDRGGAGWKSYVVDVK